MDTTDTGTILLVEDEENVRKAIKRTLKSSGARFVEASNGQQGLALLEKDNSIDLVLLDIRMPVMDGYTFLEEYRKIDPEHQRPVCVMTGNTDADTRYRAIELGADDFITKPIDVTELETRVRSLMRVRRYQKRLVDLNGELKSRVEERNHYLHVAMDEYEELKKSHDRAIEVAQLKNQFVANVSHEIRTPLNGVLGMLGLLKGSKLSNEQKDYIETAYQSAESLLTVINDILDFSKIESGVIEFENVAFDLRQVLSATLELFEMDLRQKEIELKLEVDKQVPSIVCGDAGRLRQILTNLVGNAVKFTSEGHVSVKVYREEATEDKTLLRFEVHDTGIGIDQKERKKLFRPFSQADGSVTRVYGGAGLGLAISAQLSQMMGGLIGVDSKKGEGSHFWFTAVFENQSAVSHDELVPNEALRLLRVLVVDDDEVSRESMCRQLASWSVSHESAKETQTARKKVVESLERRRPFDVVIIEMFLSQTDGIELAREIAVDMATDKPYFVLVVDSALKGLSEEARRAGIGDYLTKPVGPSQLYSCLLAAADKQLEGKIPLTADHRQHSTLQGRILIAEDNIVNQKVAAAMARRLGCHADVVANGLEALEILARVPYDLVLMDCQMPEMDGFEATNRIRAQENDKNHITIIAMTADALHGDRQRCLEGGMDDYIAKPVTIDSLYNKLKEWLPQKVSTDTANAKIDPASVDENEDERDDRQEEILEQNTIKELLAVMGEDAEELINAFLANSPDYLRRITEAAGNGDMGAFVDAAHGLKGSSGNIGAMRLYAICGELADLGRSGDLHNPEERLNDLMSTYEQTETELQTLKSAHRTLH